MRGLDTNVLVRYIAQDDPHQSLAAERIVEDALAENESIYICVIVLCELVWVLRSAYRLTKLEIIPKLDEMLSTPQFLIQHDSLVRESLSLWRSGRGDFSDHLIGALNRAADCRETVSFDRALAGTEGFLVIR
jgi:predicted nucleic-acid-binding protein